jgi:Skp family chaperone for outer membrane proteins
MKTLVISCLVSILFLVTGITFSQQEISKLRIGTFDSRCVAVAYGRSADFMKEIDVLRNDVAKAKEDGNEELAKELEQQGPTKQVLMHQQVFSNGSINNILEKIKDKLPTLAKDNNVKMILSKWEIPFADDSFEYVDITDQLVKFFNPDDATKKIIDNIKAMEPIPIEKISINPMD